MARLPVPLLTKQRQQAHDHQDRLPQQLDVGRPGVVDLEAGGQRALGEGVWVVAEEGIVVAQQGVVEDERHQVLVLIDHLVRGVGNIL